MSSISSNFITSLQCHVLLCHRSNIPNRLVKLSAASRKGVVEMALSLEASTGTSLKDFLPSKKVPPGGYAAMLGYVSERL